MSISMGLSARAKAEPLRPNFLVIVADDLGISDVGAFGGEISTPNLDALAYAGIRFTDFHTAPWCVPSRAMLMSGTDPNLALTAFSLRPDALSIAELLADAGYRTLFSGKWHLGVSPEQDPHRRGFQRSFALQGGEHNHFGRRMPGGEATYTENGQPFTELPKDFYSSDYFSSRLIGFLRETRTQGEGRKPFFAYLAFTAPHAPLHAPREEIEKYRGRYDAGFDALKEKRLVRQKELGLLGASVTSHQPLLWTGYPTGTPATGRWDAWSVEQQQVAARDMEIYAAMVDRLDQNVGRVVAALKEMDEFDNTVILFLSDNGPQGAFRLTEAFFETLLKRSPDLAKELVGVTTADNRLANRGSPTSHVRYAPGWAEAAAAPFWLYKQYATEGGTRPAAFLRLPDSMRGGQIASIYLSVTDVLPTFLDLAGVPQPKGQYEGRTMQPVMGRSWHAWLKGDSPYVYGPNDAVGMMSGAPFPSNSLRQGEWKITDVDGNGHWMLFNVADDPGETQDLSRQHTKRKSEMLSAFNIYVTKVGGPCSRSSASCFVSGSGRRSDKRRAIH